MKTEVFSRIILAVVFVWCFSSGLAQNMPGKASAKPGMDEKSTDTSLQFQEWLMIEKAMKLARQNPSELISINKSGELDHWNFPEFNANPILYSSDFEFANSNHSLILRPSVIDLSRSKTLDYKALSEKYPKSNEMLNMFGSILLSIYQDQYLRRNYDMFMIKR